MLAVMKVVEVMKGGTGIRRGGGGRIKQYKIHKRSKNDLEKLGHRKKKMSK